MSMKCGLRIFVSIENRSCPKLVRSGHIISSLNLHIFQFAVSQFTVRIATLSAEAGFSESLDLKTVNQRDMDESVRPQKLLKLSENNVALTVSAVAAASSS
jgi:hypothetical protein